MSLPSPDRAASGTAAGAGRACHTRFDRLRQTEAGR